MEYVKVHPALAEKAVTGDFENGNETWSHVIWDLHNHRLYFGDLYNSGDTVFNFDQFRLQAGDATGYHWLTWAQAREFAQAIIKLADKHEMLPTSGVGTDRPCNRPFMGED